MEIWKDIKGYKDLYQVSNLGRVKSLSRKVKVKGDGYRVTKEKLLKLKEDKGYLRVALYKGGGSKFFLVHRILLEAFLMNPKDKPWVNHKNGIKLDNRLENLEWCTISENVQHAFDKLGRKNPRRILKESDIPKIKKLYSEGLIQREIGEIFGIKRNTISRVLLNQCYGLEK